jgi:hypothetical protein
MAEACCKVKKSCSVLAANYNLVAGPEYIAEAIGEPVMAEDSVLPIPVLGGATGGRCNPTTV